MEKEELLNCKTQTKKIRQKKNNRRMIEHLIRKVFNDLQRLLDENIVKKKRGKKIETLGVNKNSKKIFGTQNKLGVKRNE